MGRAQQFSAVGLQRYLLHRLSRGRHVRAWQRDGYGTCCRIDYYRTFAEHSQEAAVPLFPVAHRLAEIQVVKGIPGVLLAGDLVVRSIEEVGVVTARRQQVGRETELRFVF